MTWRDIEDFAVSGIVILTCMAIGWAVVVSDQFIWLIR